MSHIIVDNKIDTDFIEKTFNAGLNFGETASTEEVLTSFFQSGVITNVDEIITSEVLTSFFQSGVITNVDEIITSFLQYEGLVSVGDEINAKKYCYCFANGDKLFFRRKFPNIRLHKDGWIYLSRQGEEVPALGDNAYDEEFIEKISQSEKPPFAELKIMFEHILSTNDHFYIFFSDLYVDDNIEGDGEFINEAIRKREIRGLASGIARNFLVNLFNVDKHADRENFIIRVTKRGE